jgi:hypothetical protein
MQTNNLPEPTIKNGKEHFQAIISNANQSPGTGERGGNWGAFLTAGGEVIWSGSVQSTVHGFDGNTTSTSTTVSSVGPLVFEPDEEITFSTSLRVSANHGTGGNGHIEFNGTTTTCGNPFVMTTVASSGTIGPGNPLKLFGQSGVANANLVAIEVDGEVLVDAGPLTAAQAAFPNGLWWIKDRDNSNNHQLASHAYSGVIGCPTAGTYQASFPAYSAPSGDSVAWCWGTDASGLNLEAGFEIIQELGTATAKTINHRLGKEPKMIMCYAGRNDLALTMYHSAPGPNYRATMSSSGPFYNEPAWWGGDPTEFNANTFGVGSSPYTNDSQNFNGGITYFVWTDIPGYSAFGSYTGNSDADGPFIYTGFRPAFLLIKGQNVGSSWFIYDTTRDILNPANRTLNSDNGTATEVSAAFQNIDLVSNGFKLRTNNASFNAGYNYIYAAFAENPFGGENAAPATAR